MSYLGRAPHGSTGDSDKRGLEEGTMVRMGAREALNKLKWHPRHRLREARVTIAHRGGPGNVRVIEGGQILELGRAFMRVASPEGEVEIPYHRVLRIEVAGRTLWRKEGA